MGRRVLLILTGGVGMICPYIVTRKIVTQWRPEYDEEGRQTFAETVEANEAIPIPCEKENCGAWRDGRCQYYGEG